MNIKLWLLLSFNVFFIYPLQKKPVKLTAEDKINLEEKIENFHTTISLKAGSGYYFYRDPGISDTVIKQTPLLSLEVAVKIKPFEKIYQSLNVSLTKAKSSGKFPSENTEGLFYNTDINGTILLLDYNVSYRIYSFMGSSHVGWTYKYFYFGGGPATAVYINWQHKTSRSSQPQGFSTVKFGLSGYTGLVFSLKDSPLSAGVQWRFTDIFAHPAKSEKISDYNFFESLLFHQTYTDISFVLNFQI